MKPLTIGDSIWLVEGAVVNFYGFPYPTRSVIIRLEGGGLWVWSPVELSESLRAEVDKLGPVRHLVSPNKIHHLYLSQWRDAYPEALLWGPASTVRKRPDLAFHAALDDFPPPEWRDEIDQFWFRGSPALDEVVFFHHPSSTAIIADLSENFGDEFLNAHWSGWKRAIARLWKITEGYGYAPLELRATWFKRRGARQSLHRLLVLNPKQVVMAHGEWQRDRGREYLEQAFAWLMP